jgi:hypothetical protein
MYDIQNLLSISFILVGNGMLTAICCSGQLPPIFELLTPEAIHMNFTAGMGLL